jgi:6-phosphogluconolactonase/glucosamine-6-phosphate isomerase/deaminase
VYDDAAALADAAANYLLGGARSAGDLAWALSGGTTPRATWSLVAQRHADWAQLMLYQVDERVAPTGDPARNLTDLAALARATGARVAAMPVEDPDLAGAATRYGDALPATLDLEHLGLGADGHCASLVPDDPVLTVTDRAVAVTAPYRGHRRMTLTYPALARARQLVWLVAGADKRDALARLLDADPASPAARVEAGASLILADRSAAGPERGGRP